MPGLFVSLVFGFLLFVGTAKIVRVAQDAPYGFSSPLRDYSPPTDSVSDEVPTRVQKTRFGTRLVPGEKGCEYFPEIVLVQDVSSSFEDDMQNLAKLMPELFEFFQEKFQGRVRFSIVSFVDKPVFPFGWSEDFCANVDLPLTAVDTPEAMDQARVTFKNLIVGGGSDWLEGANEAVYRAAASDAVGWSEGTHDPLTGQPILRLLVLATDAAVHEPGYHANKVGVELPDFDMASQQSELNADINYGCGQSDYPPPEELRRVMMKRGVTPIIFSGVNYFWSGANKQMWSQYRDLLQLHGQMDGPWADFETGLAEYYSSFLKDQLRMDGVVEIIDNSSANFIEVFRHAMEEVKDLTCLQVEDSTESPETTTETKVSEPPVGTRPPSTSTNSPIEETTTTEEIEETTITGGNDEETTITGEIEKTTRIGEIEKTTRIGGIELETTGTEEPVSTPSTTGTEESGGGGGAGVIIGSAAGGAAAAAAVAGVLLAKKLGIAGFGGSSGAVDPTILGDVENVDVSQDRDQFEAVRGDIFT